MIVYCVVRTRTALVTTEMGRDIIADLRFHLFTANTLTAHHTTKKSLLQVFLLLYKNMGGSSEKLVVPSYRKYVWQNKIIMLVGGR